MSTTQKYLKRFCCIKENTTKKKQKKREKENTTKKKQKKRCTEPVSLSAVATGRGEEGQEAVPPNGCLCPLPFGLLKILFLEYHATTRQLTMIKKEIITFKHHV